MTFRNLVMLPDHQDDRVLGMQIFGRDPADVVRADGFDFTSPRLPKVRRFRESAREFIASEGGCHLGFGRKMLRKRVDKTAFGGVQLLEADWSCAHAMHFFQIEFAGRLSGDCEVIAGGKILLELEGLGGGSHPADFLRIMSDGAKPVHVIYSRPSNDGSFVLQIVSGSVIVIFDFEFPDEILSDLAALDEAAYLRQCDRFARLDSIYALRKPDGPVRSDTKFAVTAAAYLAAMT